MELLAQHGLWGRLLQTAASLDADMDADRAALQSAAAAFRSSGQSDTACELLNKLGDHKVCLYHIQQKYSSLQICNLLLI